VNNSKWLARSNTIWSVKDSVEKKTDIYIQRQEYEKGNIIICTTGKHQVTISILNNMINRQTTSGKTYLAITNKNPAYTRDNVVNYIEEITIWQDTFGKTLKNRRQGRNEVGTYS